ncbi:MAG: hypothetical protein EA402_08075 [Planctomycetota bacterium]|nr:MAG: hypothetical protein EA402_08075 [Planctomycetota bacterium]
MAIIRSQTGPGKVAGQAVRLANPAVERSLAAWERRVETAEQQAYERARAEVQAEMAEQVASATAKAKAAEEALAKAEEALRAEYAERWGLILSTLANIETELGDLRNASLRAAEGEALRLALAIAGQILAKEVEADSAAWLGPVLAQALADLPARRGLSIRLDPDTAAKAQEQLLAAMQNLAQPIEMPRIEADPVLKLGECRIESGGTVIDPGLPGAWKRVSNYLLAAAPAQDLSHQLAPPPIDRGEA